MLIAQAVLAAEIFTGKRLGTEITDRIYSELLSEKENIVLIGMPAAAKARSEEYSQAGADADL